AESLLAERRGGVHVQPVYVWREAEILEELGERSAMLFELDVAAQRDAIAVRGLGRGVHREVPRVLDELALEQLNVKRQPIEAALQRRLDLADHVLVKPSRPLLGWAAHEHAATDL